MWPHKKSIYNKCYSADLINKQERGVAEEQQLTTKKVSGSGLPFFMPDYLVWCKIKSIIILKA